jgi:DNA repair ATPase RecN
MARRYINRNTKEHFKRLASYDDSPKHITEKGPAIPDFDETLKPKRIIYLKDIESSPQTFEEVVSEKITDLVNAAEETSQYIKQVNTHLDKQKLKIDELKRLQKIYESQMRSLEGKPED